MLKSLEATQLLPDLNGIEKMERRGTFAEEWVIRSTAKLFRRPIIVVSSKTPKNEPTSVLFQIECSAQNSETSEPFRVGHLVEGQHYMPLGKLTKISSI